MTLTPVHPEPKPGRVVLSRYGAILLRLDILRTQLQEHRAARLRATSRLDRVAHSDSANRLYREIAALEREAQRLAREGMSP